MGMNNNLDAKEISWQLFNKTGEIKYYLLYKALK